LVVHFYQVDVLTDLNVSRSLNFHFDSVIPASLAGVFLHSTSLSSLYLNPPCPLQKLKCVSRAPFYLLSTLFSSKILLSSLRL